MKTITMGLLACAVAGCGGGGDGGAAGREKLADNARFATVSADQQYLVTMTDVVRKSGITSGSLSVQPAAGGSPTALGANAFAPSFNRSGHSLFFLTDPLSDPSAVTHYFGHLQLWTPSLGQPVAIGQGYDHEWVQPPDNSVDLFAESPSVSPASAQSIRLFKTADCTSPAHCQPTTLAVNAQLQSLNVSLDGRFAAYGLRAPSGEPPAISTWLVRVSDGKSAQVASTSLPSLNVATHNFATFSPDGGKLATVSDQNGQPLRPVVIDTGSFAALPWGAAPPNFQTLDLAFSDANTLFVQMLDGNGGRGLYRSDSGSVTFVVAANYFVIRHFPTGAERYLFFTGAADADLAAGNPSNVEMIDLATGAQSHLVTEGYFPVLSDDLQYARVLDPYDRLILYGTLRLISLPGGAVQVVARSVYGGGVSFVPGSHNLVYFGDRPSGPRLTFDSGAPLYQWSDGQLRTIDDHAVNYGSANNPPTIYMTVADPNSGATTVYRQPLPSQN